MPNIAFSTTARRSRFAGLAAALALAACGTTTDDASVDGTDGPAPTGEASADGVCREPADEKFCWQILLVGNNRQSHCP